MVDGRYPFSPYCGSPPAVATLWMRWNLDPALIAALIAALVAWMGFQALSKDSPAIRRKVCFCAGWAVAAMAWLSPLCALSVSLFAARVGQHMMLATIAAPLLALGLPSPRLHLACNPLLAALGFAAAFWFWHAPVPYTATFRTDAAYWLMHVTTFGTAIWLWRAVFRARAGQFGASIAATLLAGVQMALLGAIITFLPRPIYAPHALTTVTWGLTPLQDQQLGGVIMWLPAGAIFASAILAPLATMLRNPGRRLSAALVS